MYAITIVFQPLPGRTQELIDLSLAIVGPSRAEPDNLFFDVLISEDRNELVFYEAYADEAGFARHMDAAHTKAWQVQALPMILESSIRFPAHRSLAPVP
ncbi:Antibiotic biosynthesis monooxygenase [Enhygromyxa salina]|uniref:Antibiotic biosynthesis monooxygenase n=1 Tax=Enhygromyxa salina TaxID=215803 RepID=A0A2S9XAZ9_9BACT|nr:putative quinol monooxygenase [Enhygromyxa salina]PRP90023.1 Antibiotic biosynthesis monooxygenase [Enhygromyxa salina]